MRLAFNPCVRHSPGMLCESFKEFVLDQLGALPEMRAKPMFGGYGLYQADRFFAILMDGRLYFKTDEQTRAAYVERRMGPFLYEKARRTLTINYFEVPPDVLESRDELVAWARKAIQAQAAKRRKSATRSK